MKGNHRKQQVLSRESSVGDKTEGKKVVPLQLSGEVYSVSQRALRTTVGRRNVMRSGGARHKSSDSIEKGVFRTYPGLSDVGDAMGAFLDQASHFHSPLKEELFVRYCLSFQS